VHAGLQPFWNHLARPILLFWGLVDQRLDPAWCRALAGVGTLVLVGPMQAPPEGLEGDPRIVFAGPVPYEDLPALAAAADVLVMPYADAPVTRAMQPLKFKEYLATGKPVVVRKLPATEPWSDAADVVATPAEMTERLQARLKEGVPVTQIEARRRLVDETWDHKAAEFERVINGEGRSA
jgi:glycosyltransferase involved in cell wall biosynthesis